MYDPFFNLAAEEYFLQKKKEDFFILSINDPSIIIGKHQVAHREANVRFVSEMSIPVIRRISGGGTVYHDRGNLNFAFIRQGESGKQIDFRFYTQGVINFLLGMGVDVRFEGKSDLTVNGLKVSGNAEHVFKDRILHHGTLLFDASLENLKLSLNQETGNYITKAVQSNRSSVVNLKIKLNNVKDIYEFESLLMNFFLNDMPGNQAYILSADEKSEIEALADSKYRTWEWNYAYGPPYEFINNFKIGGRLHSCRLYVKDGIIWECSVEDENETMLTGKNLIGCRHMYSDLLKVFHFENSPITDDEIYNFF